MYSSRLALLMLLCSGAFVRAAASSATAVSADTRISLHDVIYDVTGCSSRNASFPINTAKKFADVKKMIQVLGSVDLHARNTWGSTVLEHIIQADNVTDPYVYDFACLLLKQSNVQEYLPMIRTRRMQINEDIRAEKAEILHGSPFEIRRLQAQHQALTRLLNVCAARLNDQQALAQS